MTNHIPTPPGFFDAVLRVLSRHKDGVARGAVLEATANAMSLTPEQRDVRIPSGTALAYRHRAGWALTMLKHAGLARSVKRGVWGITEAGASLVAKRPNGLTDDDVREAVRIAR